MFYTNHSKAIWRGVVSALAFAVPFFIGHYPEYANITLGAALNAGLYFLEKKYTMITN